MRRRSALARAWRYPALQACLVWVFTTLLFVIVLRLWHLEVWPLSYYGVDGDVYVPAAVHIQTGTLRTIVDTRFFFGLPFLVAIFSNVTGLSADAAFLAVCWLSSIFSVWLIALLYGRTIALWFALANFCWIRSAAAGGTEPLFCALIMLGIWCLRRQHPRSAALIAALATTVRPVGIFLLLGIGIQLLIERRYRALLAAVGLAGCVGMVYAGCLVHLFGSPLIHYSGHVDSDWFGHSSPVQWPVLQLLRNTLQAARASWRYPLEVCWQLVVFFAAGFALWKRPVRAFFRRHVAETTFAITCLLFLTSYAFPGTAVAFPRYVLPILPLVYRSLHVWLPRRPALLLLMGFANSVFAVIDAAGWHRVFGVLLIR